MRKKYLHQSYGQGDNFWDTNWQDSIPNEPKVDNRLVNHIEKYLRPGSRLLEGGCGNANYVRYFHGRQFKVTGIDFALKTVDILKERFPQIDVRAGDVTCLDFKENTFDAYYSGGVIEHFEEGPFRPLREAFRVLRNGGFFFVTVPHENISRKLRGKIFKEIRGIDLNGRLAIERNLTGNFDFEKIQDYHFHEYFFDSREMRYFLVSTGFNIVEEVSFSSKWGLLDNRIFGSFAGVAKANLSLLNKVGRKIAGCAEWIEGQKNIPRIIADIQAETFGNLKLYVCRADKVNYNG